jgi:hypothetical protein
MKRFIFIAIAAVLVCGCATRGAGTTQDPCGLAQVQRAVPAETAQQQQQALETGQRASNQPTMTDPVRTNPMATWGGGAGAVSAENTVMDERSQSGAPSVNQGLLFPANQNQEQDAAGCVAGEMPHPQIMSLDRQIKNCEARLSLALSRGDTETADAERAHLQTLNEQYALAAANTAKTVNHTYNFEGAYITQGVSSSSTASGKPGSAETTDQGTSATAEEIVRAAGAPAPAVTDSPRSPAPVEPE